MNKYTLYWKDGKRELVTGTNISDAFTRAGYARGAIAALDFYKPGDDHSYEWSSDHVWSMK
jgi:hypothetical protein